MTPDRRPTTVDRTLRFLMLQVHPQIEDRYETVLDDANATLLDGYVNTKAKTGSVRGAMLLFRET